MITLALPTLGERMTDRYLIRFDDGPTQTGGLPMTSDSGTRSMQPRHVPSEAADWITKQAGARDTDNGDIIGRLVRLAQTCRDDDDLTHLLEGAGLAPLDL